VRLVLTGMASVVLQWMMGSQNLDSAAGRFHALDLVPVSALRTNETNTNGTYKESPNMAALEARCAPVTLGFFVGNPAYAIIILQGVMGARNLNKLCAQRKIELTVASTAVYNLFGMQRSDVAFTATETFGLRLLNRVVSRSCSSRPPSARPSPVRRAAEVAMPSSA